MKATRVLGQTSIVVPVFFALVIGTSPATADPQGPWIQPAADLSATGQDAELPRITTAPDGTAAVVWRGSNSSSDIIQSTSTAQPSFLLSVARIGSGYGTVVSSPAGIDCRKDCGENYLPHSRVTLTATPETWIHPETRSTFEGWGGACEGTAGNTCRLTMLNDLNVTAYFGSARLNVTKVRPKMLTVKRRKKTGVRATAKNSGDGKAKDVELCINVRRGVRKKVKPKGKPCRELGSLDPGQAKTRSFKLKATGRARKGQRYKVILIGSAANAGAIDTYFRIKVR
jgi:hypothetical protein